MSFSSDVLQVSPATANGKSATFSKRNTCILCDSDRLEVIWRSSFDDPLVRHEINNSFYSGEPLKYLQGNSFTRSRCCSCGMTFMSDILSDEWLKVLYGQWISVEQVDRLEAEQDLSLVWQAQQNFKHCLRLKKMLNSRVQDKACRPLRVLDFGCGDGAFLRMASLLGFESVGIDFSDSRQERVQRLGAVSLYSNLENLTEALVENSKRAATEAALRFDAITLFQVMEHLADPLGVLKSLAMHTERGGILIMEVPDASALGNVPGNEYEYGLADPLEHINQFTPDTLALMARQAGFEPVTPAIAFAAGGFKGVIKEIATGVIARSPLRALKRSTNQYFRKV